MRPPENTQIFREHVATQRQMQGQPGEVLERLLRESEALRRCSEALAAEVEALRAQSSAKNGRPTGRWKKPRLRGK
jgi:hypothetical protein